MARLPWVVVALAVAAIAGFDLATPLPFNDEFIYQWTARRLAEGHGLVLYPGQAPIALVQLVSGAAAYLAHPDPRLARLTALPFIAATVLALYRVSRSLGAAPFFAAVAAAALPAMPVYAAASTGFMTEPYYLGLLALVAWAGCHWLQTGRGGALVVVSAGIAALQRQHAAAIPPALTVAMVLSARVHRPAASRWAVLGMTWVVVLAALLLPAATGLQTVQMQANLAATTHPVPGALAAAALYLPATTGLGLVAFAVALVGGVEPGARRWWQRPVVPALAGMALLVLLLTYILPGNYLTRAGLNPITVAGAKPPLLGVLLPVLGMLGVGAFALAVAQPAQVWAALPGRPAAAFLAVLGGLALLPLLNGDVFDRYYLPVLLPLLPLAAVAAGRARAPRAARAWAISALLAGVGVFVVGEQDYIAWQGARQQAERLVTRTVAARDVFSGFEPYGVEVVLPEFERTGRLAAFSEHRTTTAMVPSHPRAALLISDSHDPRPGFGYASLAPGRVVVVCLDPAGCG